MKLFSIFLSLLFSSSFSHAQTKPSGYCYDLAKAEMQAQHHIALEQEGLLEGYDQEINIKYTKIQTEMDTLNETYDYIVTVESNDGRQWIYSYAIRFEVWLTSVDKGDCILIPEN